MKKNRVLHEPVFIDTNIWLYAFLETEDPDKSRMARTLLRQNTTVSVQVINEICVNMLKKANLPEEKIQRLIASFYKKYQVFELDRKALIQASLLRQKYMFSYWDSLIVSSALATGSKRLYSEDMQHNMIIENTLRIQNPFQP